MAAGMVDCWDATVNQVERNTVMETTLWRELPEHLLDMVLAGLPVQSLTRFRSVCKRWESMLLSPNFLKLCAGRQSEKPWFLFSGPSGECIAHNPNSNKWVIFPLNFLPSFKSVAAASRGLLCIKGDDDRIFVCNPLTRSSVELPPMSIQRENPVMGLVVDKDQNSFKLIVTSSFYDSLRASDVTTEVYDSVSRSWKLIDSRLSRFPLQREALSYNGFLYSAGCSTVLVYDVNNEMWNQMDSPVMELGVTGPKLDTTVLPKICECKGRLLMVAITVNSALVITRVAIWELAQERSSARWKEMEVLPAPMLEEVVRLLPHGYLSNLPQYSGNDDLMCLVIASSRVLVHCISHRTWYWLPPCPFVREFGPKAFAFQPIPSALV
ncbi:hypothetical protein AXG93_3296s1070 [Marchantia polymorpha subsp. ruderalis]|uniref:F-box domain-containing protein n=1 Tax=Marchantia polymorpha subsp. ruderalis TaxID=1480154 RepID=A0A176WJN5_MARPO|nr:hypothetical protein AXG93_3296s1070 [Marchantia polymorpha subsp. ruderalis]